MPQVTPPDEGSESDDNLYCSIDGIEVRLLPAATFLKPKVKHGKEYVHVSLLTATGNASCGRRVLTADDVEHLTEAQEA